MKVSNRTLIIIVVVLAVIAAVCFGIGAATTASKPPVPAQFALAPQGEVYNDGVYEVGTDIPAGEYYAVSTPLASGVSPLGYINVSRDNSGDSDSVIYIETFEDAFVFTIEEGQYLEVHGAEFTLSSNVQPRTNEVSGMLRVGIDIEPGDYKLMPTGDGLAYVVVYSSTRHGEFDNIITNDNFSSPIYISVDYGQYLYLSDCTIER